MQEIGAMKLAHPFLRLSINFLIRIFYLRVWEGCKRIHFIKNRGVRKKGENKKFV